MNLFANEVDRILTTTDDGRDNAVRSSELESPVVGVRVLIADTEPHT